MTLTRNRAVPALAVVGALFGALFLARQVDTGDEPLPRTAAYDCRGREVELEFGADLGDKARPVKIRYRAEGMQFTLHELTTDWWTTVETELPCPTTAELTVNANDVWGGNTECWIEVNGRRVVQANTRRREQCAVSVKLY